MDSKAWELLLAQLTGTAGLKALSPELDVLCRQLATTIREQSPNDNTADVLPALYLRIANHVRGLESAAPATSTLTPEILEWATATFSEAETLAELREIEATGGLSFEQLTQGLDTPTHE